MCMCLCVFMSFLYLNLLRISLSLSLLFKLRRGINEGYPGSGYFAKIRVLCGYYKLGSGKVAHEV